MTAQESFAFAWARNKKLFLTDDGFTFSDNWEEAKKYSSKEDVNKNWLLSQKESFSQLIVVEKIGSGFQTYYDFLR